jgi:hypothetical protein
MIVGDGFRKYNPADSPNDVSKNHRDTEDPTLPAVEIILDIERQNWDFKVQAGKELGSVL